ncbi:MAG: (2Fe-2S) ferredoxin domain-containing protein [Chloroflexi bacterium]|nr:(2Fe-2S) ferredoxin domain-containing protein [Chloroflexota bacterium]
MTNNVTPRRKRIVVCRGQYCNMDGRADKLLKRLQALVDEINGDQYPKPVKLEIANCLSMCGAGPNIIIYPEGEIFNHVNDDLLDEIIDEYVRER